MAETTSVRLPSEMARRLGRLTKALDRPKSSVIKKALQEYMDEYEDYLLAIDRLRDKNDRAVSREELRKKLGL